LSSGANPNKGQSLFYGAVRKEALQLLLVAKGDVNSRDEFGATALHYATNVKDSPCSK
jgi:ankyrin repeat protein